MVCPWALFTWFGPELFTRKAASEEAKSKAENLATVEKHVADKSQQELWYSPVAAYANLFSDWFLFGEPSMVLEGTRWGVEMILSPYSLFLFQYEPNRTTWI